MAKAGIHALEDRTDASEDAADALRRVVRLLAKLAAAEHVAGLLAEDPDARYDAIAAGMSQE